MKKFILVFLSLFLLLSFIGCSNPSGGSDDSNPAGGDDNGTNTGSGTSSAATWQIQNGWIKRNGSCEFTTEDKSNDTANYRRGTKISLENPTFTEVSSYSAYQKTNGAYPSTPAVTSSININTLSSTPQEINIINIKEIALVNGAASIIFQGTRYLVDPESQSEIIKTVITFNDNSSLTVYSPAS